MSDQPLPASLEAERAVLGAILLDNRKYGEARTLTTEYFSLEAHRRIFARIAELIDVDQSQADIVLMSEQLRKNQQLESVGGVAYLASLTDGVAVRTSIQHYVDLLVSKYQSRRIIELANSAMMRAYEQADKPEDILSDL